MYPRHCFLLISALLVQSGVAFAQDKPAGLLATKTATSGKTDVAKEGFEASAVPTAEPSDDATELGVSAGGLFASGNSRSLAATAAGQLRLRRDVHQLSVAAAVNYGRSAPPKAANAPEAPMQTTIENYQGRLRYDWFVAEDVALFLAISGRRDPFQGLDLRFNLSPGVAYYVVNDAKQRLWGELGYDLQHDVRNTDAISATPALERTETRHNARLFLGYENKLNDAVVLNTGAEYLLSLSPYEDDTTKRVNWRLSWDAGVTTHLSERFALGTAFSLRYDNNPLPAVHRTDSITSINLTYTLL
jgi:putative salt-induced outer membrane protein